MIEPTKKSFKRSIDGSEQLWCSERLHPNPRLYKYRFQIYTPDSPWEGSEFFEKAPRLNVAEAAALMARLRRELKGCLVYNSKVPRKGGIPFDATHPRWQGIEFAPSFDEDMDPLCEGHK